MSFSIDHHEIDISVAPDATKRLISNAMRDILNHIERTAKANAPRRTGNLVRNIKRTPVRHVGQWHEGSVGVQRTAPYGKYVEFGTGIFGVFKRRITPRTGNLLVFKWYNPALPPRKRQKVFAHSVKGQRGQHFMRRAYIEARTFYVPARIQLLKRELAAAIKNK